MTRQVAEEGTRQLRPSSEEESAPLPDCAGAKRPSPSRKSTIVGGWQACVTRPAALLAVGVVLLALGAALVATPLALRAGSSGGSQALSDSAVSDSLNEEGVPLDALPSEQQNGEVSDCKVALQNRTAYMDAALAAEAQLFGAAAADLNATQLHTAVDGQPSLLFGTVFWVLVSGQRPWSPEFEPAAAVAVATANAAFASAHLRFRLDAVISVPASNDAVMRCDSLWPQLAAQLLPQAVNGSILTSQNASSNAASAASPALIHVVVCDPEGVNGAAAVLGDVPPSSPDGGSSSSSSSRLWPSTQPLALLLRRSALWQSRTSLAHQLGHVLGLPHPFPDERQTCRADGDGIADTPRHYAPNTGCPLDSDQHVCPDSQDGAVPAINFMDLTNDTCRRHFTLGQVARMRAMLQAHRPDLVAAAAASPQPSEPLPVATAWQSAPPSFMLSPPNPWQQAALAADGVQSAAAANCTCLGPDREGEVFWTAQLNASRAVEAVRLLLPAQAVFSSEDGNAAAAAAATAQQQPAGLQLSVQVWVGDSLDFRGNQPCAPSMRLPDQPLVEVRCGAPVVGRLVTVQLSAAPGAPPLAQQLRRRAACLCEVTPLAAVVLPLPVSSSSTGGGGSQGPAAVPLNTSGMEASQSSTAAWAALALASQQQQQLGAAGPQCSTTGLERTPWWSLDMGLDAAWVRGLRLSVPYTCQPVSRAAQGGAPASPACVPTAPTNLSVYVSNAPQQQPLAGAAGSSSLGVPCVVGALVPGGRPVEVECTTGFLHGRYVTIVAEQQHKPFRLSLCGVELLGACELTPGQHMAQPQQLMVSPSALQPYFALPVDGNPSSCLQGASSSLGASASSASWQLQLDGSYPLVSVRLTATPVENGSLTVSLLDAGGAVVASNAIRSANTSTASTGAAQATSLSWELPARVYASALRIQGFARLCEVQLLSGALQAARSHQLNPLDMQSTPAGGSSCSSRNSSSAAGRWRVVLGEQSSESLPGSNADALFDGNLSSCLTIPMTQSAGKTATQRAALQVLLGRPYRIETVELVLGGANDWNMSIAAAAPNVTGGSFSAVWKKAAVCQGPTSLRPWKAAAVPCAGGPLLADRLLLRATRSQAATAGSALSLAPADSVPTLQLCGLYMFGLPEPV